MNLVGCQTLTTSQQDETRTCLNAMCASESETEQMYRSVFDGHTYSV